MRKGGYTQLTKYTGASSRVDSRWYHTCRRPFRSLNLKVLLMPRNTHHTL